MTATTLATASHVQKWDASFLSEYVRFSGFKPYISRGSNSVICAKYELSSGGKTINIPLVTRLTGNGVTGSAALEGSEEALGNYNHAISIEWLRNAVLITKDQQHYTEMDLRRAARDQLSNWAMSGLRDAIIEALRSVGGTAWATAIASQTIMDTWLENNKDRVLFGSAISNLDTAGGTVGADWSDSIAGVAATEKLSAANVSLMKRIAKTADPHIRPMRVNNEAGREYYVLFTDSRAFRDLKADAVITAANREARPRDVESNPLFQDGDLIYDGVIIREIPEIPSAGTIGESSAAISPAFLCGAQAVGIAWGQEPKSTTDVRDYGFFRGVGIEEARGVEKMVFNDVDHGVVTGFFAAAADA